MKTLLISLAFLGLMSINAEAYSLDNSLLAISENFNEENPLPAIVIEEEVEIQEDPAWTYRFLIPISVAIATLVIVGNVIQYFPFLPDYTIVSFKFSAFNCKKNIIFFNLLAVKSHTREICFVIFSIYIFYEVSKKHF